MFLRKLVYFVGMCVTWTQVLRAQCLGKPNKVHIDVYYSTFDSQSRSLILDHLYPIMQSNLSNYIELHLYPYGRTETVSNDNLTNFICEYGAAECYGNQVQSCAIFLINLGMNSAGLNYNRLLLEYVKCLMESVRPSSTKSMVQNASLNCESNTNLSPGLLTQCGDNTEFGTSSLKYIGEETQKLQAPLDVVPTIVFDKQLDEMENALAHLRLESLVYEKIFSQNASNCEEIDIPPTDQSGSSRLNHLWSEILVLLMVMLMK